MKIDITKIPRRAQQQKWCPAEKAIYDAIQAVEEIPAADERLTAAVNKLSEAKDLVSDFIDGVPYKGDISNQLIEAQKKLIANQNKIIEEQKKLIKTQDQIVADYRTHFQELT